MKKQYKKPITESVKVNLYNSILETGIDIINNSTEGSDTGLGKENNLLFDDDAWDDDLWGDNDNNADSYDIWKE